MARVKSFLPLHSMDETTFLKQGVHIGGYRLQDKEVSSPDNFTTAPRTARVRVNASAIQTVPSC